MTSPVLHPLLIDLSLFPKRAGGYTSMLLSEHLFIRWNVCKALEAGLKKLELSLTIQGEVMSSLPSTYLEAREGIKHVLSMKA